MAFTDNLTENVLLRIRFGLLCLLIFFSAFSFVGVGVMKSKEGFCPLYLDLDAYTIIYYESGCSYVLFVSILMQLFYPLYRTICLILFIIGRLAQDAVVFSKRLQQTYVSLEICFAFNTFVSACVLSAGTSWSCSELGKWRPCDGSSWYTTAQATQAGAWLNTFVYIAAVVFGIIYLKKTGNLPFFSSRTNQAVAYTDSSGQPEAGVSVDPALPPPANQDVGRHI